MTRFYQSLLVSLLLPTFSACSAQTPDETKTPAVRVATHQASSISQPTRSRKKLSTGSWLNLRPGLVVMIDVAPWPGGTHAALTGTTPSYWDPKKTDVVPPTDGVLEPVGVTVQVKQLLPNNIVLVKVIADGTLAYTIRGRLVPIVPAGTHLHSVGGFGGFGYLYSSTTQHDENAEHLLAGSDITYLGTGIAGDPNIANWIRYKVRIDSGSKAGEVGWLDAGNTGVPSSQPSDDIEKQCHCKLNAFLDGYK